ncbi:MAG TPA: hypothetical protein DEP35_02035 [Deltaproteobacteria bacterium]|jgi:hypothetical protein|nr:hypothetical protein [Deltaproteobacteria bacterium]
MNLKGESAFIGRLCGSSVHDTTQEGVAFYANALDDQSPRWQEVAPRLLHHSGCDVVHGLAR